MTARCVKHASGPPDSVKLEYNSVTVDVGMWLRKGKALEEDVESEESKEAKKRIEEEEAKVRQSSQRCKSVSANMSDRKRPENRLSSSSRLMQMCSLHVDCSLWISRV